MKFRSLAVLPILLAGLVAQSADVKPARPDKARPSTDMKANDAGDAEVAGEEDSRVPGKVAHDPNARRRGLTHCQFRVHTDPVKLMPGQTGTLVVTAVLKGTAVLPANAPLQVASLAQQGQVALGTPTFRPARPGHLHAGFQGTPVYDNYAIMELPVSVAAEAKVGSKLPVHILLDYELFDGNSAASIGKFQDTAIGAIEVGQVLDPPVQGGFTPIDVVEESNPEAASAGATPAVGAPGPGVDQPEAIGGADVALPRAQPAEPGEPAAAPGPSLPAVASEEGLPWGLILGGGGLLVLVLLLAMRRR